MTIHNTKLCVHFLCVVFIFFAPVDDIRQRWAGEQVLTQNANRKLLVVLFCIAASQLMFC